MKTELLNHLQKRRSCLAINMEAPAPSPEEVEAILTMAMRVPDHKKLAPWRFIKIEGNQRQKLGQKIASIKQSKEADLRDVIFQKEQEQFMRAPLIIAVILSPKDTDKVPLIEQILSTGASAMNILHGLSAYGYVGQWLTGWAAYDREVMTTLGLSHQEQIAGFIYCGSHKGSLKDRARPELEKHVSTLCL